MGVAGVGLRIPADGAPDVEDDPGWCLLRPALHVAGGLDLDGDAAGGDEVVSIPLAAWAGHVTAEGGADEVLGEDAPVGVGEVVGVGPLVEGLGVDGHGVKVKRQRATSGMLESDPGHLPASAQMQARTGP